MLAHDRSDSRLPAQHDSRTRPKQGCTRFRWNSGLSLLELRHGVVLSGYLGRLVGVGWVCAR